MNENVTFKTLSLNAGFLPSFFKDVLGKFESYNDDVKLSVLLSLLAGFGAGLSSCFFEFEGRRVNLHFYLGLFAVAGAGKSCLSVSKILFTAEHERLRRESQTMRARYEELLRETKKEDRDLLKEPPLKTFFLPGDTTASALISTIRDNEGVGVIWEAELDTLTRSMKSEFGNFSDALRKNYDSDVISYNRRISHELVEVLKPRFSCVFSGTPQQFVRFFKSTENGLVSRFTFCGLSADDEWEDRWEKGGKERDFREMGVTVAELFSFQKGREIEFVFEKRLRERHFEFFSLCYRDFVEIGGNAMRAIVKRTSLNCVKWACVLEYVGRMNTRSIGDNRMKVGANYMTFSFQIAEAVLNESIKMLQLLPEEEKIKKNEWSVIFDALPSPFVLENMPKTKSQASHYRHISAWLTQRKIEKRDNKYYKL